MIVRTKKLSQHLKKVLFFELFNSMFSAFMNDNKIKVNQDIFTVVLTNGDSGLFPAENQVRMMLGHSGEEVSEKNNNSLISMSEEEVHRY